MSDADRRLDAFCHEEAGTILALLERLATIQSGTSNKVGVDAVADLMADELKAVGFAVECHRREVCGDHLVARRGAE
ncbi:MAG: M20 family peptidase, partial [bacterium]